jgi:hypothetical protein
VKVEITPEPSEEEEKAILAALADELKARKPWVEEPEEP